MTKSLPFFIIMLLVGTLLMWLLAYQCSYSPKIVNTNPTGQEQVKPIKKEAGNPSAELPETKVALKKVKWAKVDSILFNDIKVLSFKQNLMESSLPDTAICDTWNIKKENLPFLFKLSEPIDATAWHYQFDVLSCIVEGEFSYLSEKYYYGINAGSWFDIRMKDTTIRYGCYDKRCEKFFLSKAWVPKEAEH